MQNQTKSLVYTGFVILCWSTVATAFKIALSELSHIDLLLIASITACCIYFIEIVFSRKLPLLGTAICNKKIVLRLLLLGLLNPVLYYLVLFKAYSLLPAQVAQPINCFWQILLPVLAIPLLKRKMALFQFLGLIVSFLGIVLISSQGNLFDFRYVSLWGVGLAIFSSFVWAFYWIMKINSKTDPIVELFINFFFGSLILILYFCFFGFHFPSTKGLLSGIYVGFFEMGIAFICWAKALKYSTNTARLSQLTYLAPFLSLILIHFVVGEKIYWTTIVGLFFIVGGIFASQLKFALKNNNR